MLHVTYCTLQSLVFEKVLNVANKKCYTLLAGQRSVCTIQNVIPHNTLSVAYLTVLCIGERCVCSVLDTVVVSIQ